MAEEKNNVRIPISKKLRFEIFKRDCFKCQYCGSDAPKVMLRVDHILPVYEGGTNILSNLITSCFDCNSGKGKRKLSDESMLNKQKAQLDELEAKRQLIEMQFDWHKGLSDVDNLENVKIIQYMNGKFTRVTLSKQGENSICKLIKKYSFIEILEAIDDGFEFYKRKAKQDQQNRVDHFNRWDKHDFEKKKHRKDFIYNIDNKTAIENEIKVLKEEMLVIDVNLENLNVEKFNVVGKEKRLISLKIATLKRSIQELQKKNNQLLWTDTDEVDLKSLMEKEKFSRPSQWEIMGYSMLLDKLPGILRNKKKDKEDPEYSTVVHIYRIIQNRLNYKEFKFALTNIEKQYKLLRTVGYSLEESKNIMLCKIWANYDEFEKHIQEQINYKNSNNRG